MKTLLDQYLIYLRKSRQDNPNETIEEVLARHERQLQEYALKTFGYEIKEENIYREIVSGETIEDRPQINLIFKRLEDENIKGVLVIEPQRLTRGDMLDCGTIVHIFRYTNTLIITPNKTYNPMDKYDRKFLEMELSRGNDYLEYTKEILQRGRKASQREGNYISSVAPYGYERIKIGKSWTLKPNEKQAPYVKMIFSLYLNGLGYKNICNELNRLGATSNSGGIFKPVAIKQMLQNPVYMGKIKVGYKTTSKVYEDGKIVKKVMRNYDCELVEGKHEALISEEDYKKVLSKIGKCTHEKINTTLNNKFASLLRCKYCGQSMYLHTERKNGVPVKKPRYVCRNSTTCACVSSNSDIVDEAIVKSLKNILKNMEVEVNSNNDVVINSHQKVINSLESELKKLEVKQEELYTFLEDGIYTKDIFLERNKKLAIERERITKALDNAKETIPTIEETKNKYFSLHQALDMINDDKIDNKAKNNFLKEVIDKIYYSKESKGEDVKLEIFLR